MRNLSKILRSAAVLLGSLAILSGCGGGGGGGDSASTTPSGLRVTVSDTYGVAVAGATVEATVGTSVETRTTDAQGVALLIFSGATGTASVTVSRDTFVTFTEPAAATVAAELVTDLPITLVRATSPAGGSLTARTSLGAITPTLNGDGTLTFDIELVIVDGNSEPILGLTAADFVLKACTPDSGNDVPNFKVDCVRGTTSLAANFDAPYNSTTLHPLERVALPGAPAVPYAAALMLDQSGSIATTDPTGARLFSAKSFLDELGPGEDWVLLSAFADGTALIPTPPLAVYAPFRDSTTVSSTPSYYDTLDSLASLVGGDTPLYSALDSLVGQVADPNPPTGIAKSVIIFTDGDDTACGDAPACRTVRQASIANANTNGIRVFTIGLTSGVNFEALGELANGTGGVFLFAESPQQLIPLYGSVGRLLSLCLPTYRLQFNVESTDPNAFLSGNVLLGRVTVTAGGSTFDVPFYVAIP
jgi:hypothetical protein